MGRVCYGPSLSWAEFAMGRVVQLPVPLPEWTGMDYRNGHYAMALSALNVFYLHKIVLL